ncbi:MAG: hypothetical protein IT207_01960 [Fimbriimonadaceae bacterium]|nr:hypothetical protein [Fimbriimonadaceae bacterium]
MPSRVRATVVLSLVLVAASASAQTYGCTSVTNGNLTYEACIQLQAPFGPATGPGQKVSGTDVNLVFQGKVSKASSQTTPWQAGEVAEIVAQIGDSPQRTWTVLNGWVGGGSPDPGTVVDLDTKQARFSSTHFADEAAIPVTLTVKFDLVEPDGDRVRVEASTNVSLSAHNKHLAWANQVGPAAFGGIPSFADQTTAERAAAKDRLEAAELRHSGLGPAVMLTREQIVSSLDEATVLFASTHSKSGGAGSSFYGPQPSPGGPPTFGPAGELVSWAELQSEIEQGGFREAPLPNIVFFYSCSALAHVSPETFGMQFPYRNKAVVGFTQDVVGQLVPLDARDMALSAEEMYGPDWVTNHQPKGHLYQHVEFLFDRLKQYSGKPRTEDAVRDANAEFPPRAIVKTIPPTYPLNLATYQGDGNATLAKVYQDLTEWPTGQTSAVPVHTWYKFYP